MDTQLELYRRVVDEQPTCDGRFFVETLSRYRAGDLSAARTLSGSCLRYALAIAEDRAKESPAVPMEDTIQEANAGLMEAITTFPGDDLDSFLAYADARIRQRIAVLA